jgi:hypothetical protein
VKLVQQTTVTAPYRAAGQAAALSHHQPAAELSSLTLGRVQPGSWLQTGPGPGPAASPSLAQALAMQPAPA